ncbi:MAG: hypothetical protein KKA99_06620, partial [Gammaproteobacteria bacterium]|nr:hypothetical protein [Gammaproteobacteria bacterium]
MKQRFLIGLVVCFGLLLCARAAFSMPATGLDATNDDGFIELSWTEPTDVATASTYAYAVQRSSSGSVPWIDISDSLPEGSTEYTDVNTINNETWYYRVAAWTDSDTAYSNIVFETAYYPQRISGLTASPTFICYETNGSPDSSAITFNLYAGPGASAAKKVTITLLEAGGEIGTITIYEPASGIHTVYWDGSWGDMAATSIGANTWVAAMGTGDDWIKHNGTYGMEARATNYNDDESDVAGTGTSIGVNVVHIQRPVTIEHTVIGNNPPAYVPPYKVTYQLTKEAYVTIRIYKETATGGLGTLVRRIEEDVPRPGEQAERNLTNTQFWDGKNDTGLIVPNGKYIMTLEAHEASGCETPPEDYADTVEIVWAVDVLRLTDWDEVHITPTNPTGSISYTLSHDANCTIAIYPEGTQFTDDFPNTDPVIILVGGGPREAGSHTEEWVGLDSDGLLVPNAVYTYTISAELHGVKAVDYVGNDCPFYGTIVVNREEHEIESPTNLTATNADGVIQLSWTAPTNNIGDVTYSLYRGVNASVSPSSYSDSHPGLTSTKFSDTGTVDGTVYYYVVTAIDSAKPTDESDPSNLASAQAVYPKPPTIPGNLTTETIARKIKLTWDASQVTGGSQGSVFYRIYRSQTSPVEINDTNRIATQILTTKYTDNVSTGSYYYRVTAVDDSSMIESASSNEVLAISYFLPPEGLSAANKDGIITLTWTETKGISLVTYNIYRGTSSTSLTKVDSGVIETKWQDLDTANGVNYYYIATATDSFDNLESDPSNKVAERAIYPIDLLSVSISTNVAGIEYETNGQPDSVTITFTINAGDSDSKGNPSRVEKAVISITDHISGQEVAAFELENLPSGTYSDTWDGTWDVPGQWIKHNGSYTITGTITNYDGASPLPGVSGVYVDVVHIQQPVEIEYTTEGQNPPVLGPQYHITYQLTKSAYVIHKIYTDTGVLVRTISSDVPRMGEGFDRDITVTDYWDLRATNGSFVPNGIYHWQITAYYQGDTSTVTFDLPVQPLRLTDLTTVGIAQSEDKAQIIYTLTTDATVTIKIYAPGTTFTGGLDDNGNPIPEDASALVKTLTFSRGKGSHTESWDGTNDTGQVVANDIYMMSIIALDSHRNRAVDYNGSECPFYGTIPVYRGITPPTLSWTGETGYASDGVNPDKDKAGDTFTYRISYAHQDNTPLLAPPTLHIFKGGTEIDTELMTGVDPYDQTYSDSKLYTVDVSLTDTGADYSYYFEARDINGIPATGIPTRSIVGYMKNGPIVDNTPLVTINQIDRGGFPEIDCYVTVTDQAGDHLDGLDADSFTVTEGGGGFNGTPDTVGSPTAALSTALVMDYSGSMGDADVVNA